MGGRRFNSRDTRATGMSPGHQLVSVSRLSEVCNPFAAPPWADVTPFGLDAVRRAIEEGLQQELPYSAATSAAPWSMADHIARIAHLATHGWHEPIEVDVGVPFLDCWVDWPVTDGNHRLAAALVRGDAFILASVAGCCDYIRELLGRVSAPRAVPSHAHPWKTGTL